MKFEYFGIIITLFMGMYYANIGNVSIASNKFDRMLQLIDSYK